MADFTIIQSTDQPPLVATLTNPDNTAIDLTHATSVALLLKSRIANQVIPTSAVTILSPASAGRVGYVWKASDTVAVGEYDARFQITWEDSTTQTVPSGETPISIQVIANIATGPARLTTIAPKGYCQPEDVEEFLGITFSDRARSQCRALIGRAERWMDEETNRKWLIGPVAQETFYSPYGLDPPSFFTGYVAGWVPLGAAIILKNPPIANVIQVDGTGWLDSVPLVLVNNLDYEFRDPDVGYVRLVVPSAFYRVRVTYAPQDACPADITQATVMLVATWMIPHLNPDSWLVDEIKLPDLDVRYSKQSNSVEVPAEIDEIIERYRFRAVG